MKQLIGSFAFLFIASPVYASWVYEGQKSDFGGAGQHFALNLSADQNYSFGFRCLDDSAQAVFITPEVLEIADLEGISRISVTLLLKVDSGEAIDLDATVDSAQKLLRVTAESVSKEQLELVQNATKSVSVALRIGEKVIHETRFNARGSTTAISKFMEGCGITGN